MSKTISTGEGARYGALSIIYFLAILSAVATILLLWWIIKYSAYGIDFTDESFYLVWIANPFQYTKSTTQFGFFYNPLYLLLDGDIASLRRANVLITFSLAWGVTYFTLVAFSARLKKSLFIVHSASSAFATSSLAIFDSWLITPSYNSLNFQALMIVVIGLTLANKNIDRPSLVGWILIGVGGWMTLMAKPTSALALTIVILFYLLFARKFSARMLLLTIAISISLIMLSALAIDGSFVGFVKRLYLGSELSRLLAGGYTLKQILRIDGFHLVRNFFIFIIFLFSAIYISFWSLLKKSRKLIFLPLLFSIILFLCTALISLNWIHSSFELGEFQGLLMLGVSCIFVSIGVLFGRLQALKSISRQQWAIAIILVFLPYIYAFGTNRNYWLNAHYAGIFWLLSGLVLLEPVIREHKSRILLLPIALAVQVLTSALLLDGFEKPHRQPQPISLNSYNIELGPKNSILVLSQGYAEYIQRAISLSQKAGFSVDTPVIDLSGQSPGILFAIQAKNIGQAWMIGGYPGSLNRAVAAFDSVECKDIASSWLLLEPKGPRIIPHEFLMVLGLSFPDDYQLVSSWSTAEGAGGYSEKQDQFLYKPLNIPKNTDACNIKRALK